MVTVSKCHSLIPLLRDVFHQLDTDAFLTPHANRLSSLSKICKENSFGRLRTFTAYTSKMVLIFIHTE